MGRSPREVRRNCRAPDTGGVDHTGRQTYPLRLGPPLQAPSARPPYPAAHQKPTAERSQLAEAAARSAADMASSLDRSAAVAAPEWVLCARQNLKSVFVFRQISARGTRTHRTSDRLGDPVFVCRGLWARAVVLTWVPGLVGWC